ncbi:dihydrofolate reductase [Microvirga arsenatis]|uniref:Dihydrofolate reductase n=1 Tax=Microvirga arsenatis TaxID=2692265 RepID=A0ABW9YUY7_9HYPH|nr:dihydrofolate reductase [Microvirga arsenatis]NBJ11947.1 diacylglycerol kinase [Microvirga arsenatis]NBJ24059.1 diacylglycerol kinase [Microvirga arsenatis]
MTVPLILVVAMAENGVIGRDNRLLWRLKTDLGRFRRLTMGKPMIMGRKTFQSIGKPLPGRETVVLTRDKGFAAEGVHVAHAWEEAMARGQELASRMGADAIAVAGGAEIYAMALPHVRNLYLTEVQAAPKGDAVFPAFDRSQFREVRRESHPKGPDDEHPFTFIDLERRT